MMTGSGAGPGNSMAARFSFQHIGVSLRGMGIGLSLRTVGEVARIVLPTCLDSLKGGVSEEVADERLASFGQRVVTSARIQLEVIGRDRADWSRPYVVMSNHQSHMDIPVIYAALPLPRLRMVAKTELFRVPLWGRAMRDAGFVEVDRGDREQSVSALTGAARQIAGGTSVWIAPEGSRSRDGHLGPLKKGGFHLAKQAGVAILPVAISGTYQVLPPHGRAAQHDQRVKVVIGAPIDTVGRSVEQLMCLVDEFLRREIDLELTLGRGAD